MSCRLKGKKFWREILVAEVTVTDRTRRHGQRVRLLRENRSISKARLMDALGFGSSQSYDLYERGTSIIRLDRLEDWAGAFDMGVLDFVSVVVLNEPDPVLVARAAEALGPAIMAQTPERAKDVARELEKHEADIRNDVLAQVAAALIARGVPVSR